MAEFSRLYQLWALLSSVVPSQSHIKLISENLCHKLTWEAGNQSTTPTHYKERTWNNLTECFDTVHLSCDLTKMMMDLLGNYLFRVQAYTENGTALWMNYSDIFIPIMHTVLGPPIVYVAGCDSCLNITIQPPVCHFGSPDKWTSHFVLHKAHSVLNYRVALIKAGIMNQTPEIFDRETTEENFTITISHLLPRTNYCVSVNATVVTNMSPRIKPSSWKCAVTGPISKPGMFHVDLSRSSDHYIPAAICGVLLIFSTLLLLAVFYKGGFICLKRTPVPKSLSAFSTSEHVFNSAKDQPTSEPLHSVTVQFKAVQKRVQEYSEDDETDSEGCPEYTHHFGGRSMSSYEHFSASTGISGDSLLGEISDQEGTSLVANKINSEVCQTTPNEDKSVSSVHFASFLAEIVPAKPLENCSSYNVNLNSVLLGDSEEPWKECGASEIPLLRDLEISCVEQADGMSESSFLCDNTNMKTRAWPVFSETCLLNETALSSESEESDSDVNQAFGYMRRK
uniref:Interferon alpha/beta receptor 2 isoform X2 n=1 Tax=Geotrypetes seraphini TaxID=260995 RepID=A0A6P8R8A5_GEOSA|nr:interferon alpha/beta receptor 2 isoform X2 [Geotrypetes seraphini]